MSNVPHAAARASTELSADERQVVLDGTEHLGLGLAELARSLIDRWDMLTSEERVAGLHVVAEALIHLEEAAPLGRLGSGSA